MKTEINENRNLENLKLDNITIYNYPKEIEKFVNDNIPLRTLYIAHYLKVWNIYIKANIKFFIGEDGEWFYIPALISQLGHNPLSEDTLTKFREMLAGYSYYFNAYDMRFYYILNPDKESYMREKIPSSLLANSGVSWGKQITEKLRNDTFLNFIDLHSKLKEKNVGYRLYDKAFDVYHWNGAGRMLATDIIIDELAKHDMRYKGKKYNIDIVDIKTDLEILGSENASMLRFNDIEQFTAVDKEFFNVKNSTELNNATYVINKNFDNGTILLLTDSYWRFFLRIDTKQRDSFNQMKLFSPFAYFVKNYLHKHYGLTSFIEINKVREMYNPDIIIFATAERSGLPLSLSDPYITILGDKQLGHNINIIHKYNDCFYLNNIKLGIDNFTSGGVELKSIKTDSKGNVIVAMQFSSNKIDKMKLSYSEDNNSFDNNVVTYGIAEGKNILRFNLNLKSNSEYSIRLETLDNSNKIELLTFPEINKTEGWF